jgi:hypothetical protein
MFFEKTFLRGKEEGREFNAKAQSRKDAERAKEEWG